MNGLPHDRLIVITDEQSHDRVPDPVASKAYMVNIASGVLRGVSNNRAAILDITNRLTRDNALFPCVHHEAEAGWDVMTMMRFPLDLLTSAPEFLGQCVNTAPQVAANAAGEFVGLGGRRPEWTQQDFSELVTRSLL